MLQYEHERTTELVKRLVALGNTIRTLTILGWVVLTGALFSIGAMTRIALVGENRANLAVEVDRCRTMRDDTGVILVANGSLQDPTWIQLPDATRSIMGDRDDRVTVNKGDLLDPICVPHEGSDRFARLAVPSM